MHELGEHRLAEQVGEVLAGLAEPRPVDDDGADPESAPDELVQPNPARRQVSARLAWRELDAGSVEQRLDLFRLDQGDVAVDLRVRGVRPDAERVAVAL